MPGGVCVGWGWGGGAPRTSARRPAASACARAAIPRPTPPPAPRSDSNTHTRANTHSHTHSCAPSSPCKVAARFHAAARRPWWVCEVCVRACVRGRVARWGGGAGMAGGGEGGGRRRACVPTPLSRRPQNVNTHTLHTHARDTHAHTPAKLHDHVDKIVILPCALEVHHAARRRAGRQAVVGARACVRGLRHRRVRVRPKLGR